MRIGSMRIARTAVVAVAVAAFFLGSTVSRSEEPATQPTGPAPKITLVTAEGEKVPFSAT